MTRSCFALLTLGCLPPLPGAVAVDSADTESSVDSGPMLENGGFEIIDEVNNRPKYWSVFPEDRTQWGSVVTGDPLAEDLIFTALEGDAALHIQGADLGSQNETAIYQTFAPVEGVTYMLTGSAFVPAAQPITARHTFASLIIKMFNSEWGIVHSYESDRVSSDSLREQWIDLSASGEASSNVSYVQAAVQFWQCVGEDDCTDGEGKVYFDDLFFDELD